MNYNCVKLSATNYAIYCAVFMGKEMNLVAAKRSAIALMNEKEDYFEPQEDGRSRFEKLDDGKIEYYSSRNGEALDSTS